MNEFDKLNDIISKQLDELNKKTIKFTELSSIFSCTHEGSQSLQYFNLLYNNLIKIKNIFLNGNLEIKYESYKQYTNYINLINEYFKRLNNGLLILNDKGDSIYLSDYIKQLIILYDNETKLNQNLKTKLSTIENINDDERIKPYITQLNILKKEIEEKNNEINNLIIENNNKSSIINDLKEKEKNNEISIYQDELKDLLIQKNKLEDNVKDLELKIKDLELQIFNERNEKFKLNENISNLKIQLSNLMDSNNFEETIENIKHENSILKNRINEIEVENKKKINIKKKEIKELLKKNEEFKNIIISFEEEKNNNNDELQRIRDLLEITKKKLIDEQEKNKDLGDEFKSKNDINKEYFEKKIKNLNLSIEICNNELSQIKTLIDFNNNLIIDLAKTIYPNKDLSIYKLEDIINLLNEYYRESIDIKEQIFNNLKNSDFFNSYNTILTQPTKIEKINKLIELYRNQENILDKIPIYKILLDKINFSYLYGPNFNNDFLSYNDNQLDVDEFYNKLFN